MSVIAGKPLEERVAYFEGRLLDHILNGMVAALKYNALALEVGRCYIEAKVATAEAETNRKLKKFALIRGLMESGQNKTNAKELVEDEPEYLDAVRAAEVAAELRDRAEIVFKIAYQRASLLAGVDHVTEGESNGAG